LSFPTERFMVTYARETLINEWDAQGTNINEGVNSLGWVVARKRAGGKIRIVVAEYQWVVGFYEL
jgi:hypothetical protein